jgi:hypothetical protein
MTKSRFFRLPGKPLGPKGEAGMEEWSGGDNANASVRAVMMEARAARTKAVAQEGEERVRTRGGKVMGELASLRETLAPFRGRDEVDQLQTELARLRESAQEAAQRIAEASSARITTSTGRDRPQQSTILRAAGGTAEHKGEGEGILQQNKQEDGLSAELVRGEEDGRVEPLMGSRNARADAVRVPTEEDEESGATGGDASGSQHKRQQQQQRRQEEEEKQQQQQQQQGEGEEREEQREQEQGLFALRI